MRFIFAGLSFVITVILEYLVGTAGVLFFLLVPVGVIGTAIAVKQFVWHGLTWDSVVSIVIGSILAAGVMAALFLVIISVINVKE